MSSTLAPLSIGIGRDALSSVTGESTSLAIGHEAAKATTSGVGITALGYQTLIANTTGNYNIGVGYQTLGSNTTGSENVAIGDAALQSNVSGGGSTAVGFQALQKSTVNGNTAVGNAALRETTTGAANTAVGGGALVLNTTGGSNVAMGNQALYANTTGSSNTALGRQSMLSSTTGSNNTAVGYGTLGGNGDRNTTIGSTAGSAITTGNDNTLLGFGSGNTLTSGSNNIIIGAWQQPSTATTSNQLNIGGVIYGDISNGNIGIGTATPTTGTRLDITGTGAAASSIIIPRDTVANRPTTGVNGMIRYASDTNKFEAYENGAWTNMIGTGGAPTGSAGGDLAGTYPNPTIAASAVDNSKVAAGAAIARSKLASGNANRLVVNDGSGVMTDATAITASRALASDANGIPVASAVTATELGYVSGVTSSIQTQIDAKLGSAATFAGDVSGTYGATSVDKIKGTAVSSTTPTTSGQVLRFNGTTWVPNFVAMTDIRSTVTGSTAFASSGCAANETLSWNSVGDILTCQAIASLPASAISSGTIATARLGSGTADATTYLRGDGTWTTPSATDATKLPLAGGTMTGAILLPAGAVGTPSLSFSGDPNTGIYSGTADTIKMATAGSERMRIDSSGNVGIGTNNPSHLLDVSGTGRFNLAGGDTVTMGIGRGTLEAWAQGSGVAAFVSTSGSTGNAVEVPLVVAGQASGGLPTSGNGTAIGIQGYLSSNYRDMAQISSVWTNLTFATRSADLRFSTVDNGNALGEKMRITSDGSVGIGTTSPTTGTKLDITGTGASASSIIIPRDTVANRPTTGVNGMIRYATDTNKFEAYENGAWTNMIGTGGAPTGSAGGDLTGTYPNPTIANLAVTNAKVATAAAIARSKLASGTANRLVVNDGSGVMSDATAITANRALASDANGIPVHTSVTDTELGYLSGVTSAIQTQLSAKVGTGTAFSGDVSGAYNATSVDKIKGTAVSSTTPTTSGQVLRFNGTTWVPNFVAMTDIRSTVTGSTAFSSSGCATNETLSWNSVGDILTCQSIGSLPASAISSGTIATARLGSGTADATTYLRGDNTWVTAPADATKLPLAGGTMTGAILLSAGAVGTPSLSFSGDTNTGFYSGTADTIAASTAGTERLRISSAGIVSVGDTATSKTIDFSIIGGGGAIGTSSTWPMFLYPGNTLSVGFYNNRGVSIGATYASDNPPNDGLMVEGKVGIGTKNPSVALDVTGVIRASSKIHAGDTTGGGYINVRTDNGATSGLNTLSEISRNTASENGVRIGYLANGTTDTAGAVYSNGANPLAFGTNTAERMRIDHTTGNIGIGTSSPGYPVEISKANPTDGYILNLKNSDASSNTGSWMRMESAYPGTGVWAVGIDDTGFALWDATGSAVRFHVSGNGNTGIGTATPSEKLEVNGQVKITGGSPGAGKVLISDATGVGSWNSSPYPTTATIWWEDATTLVGSTLATWYSNTVAYGHASEQGPAADGDSNSINFFLKAGTYTMKVLGYTTSNRGKVDWYIDNVLAVSGQDWYSAGGVPNVVKSATVTVVGDGNHVLKSVVNGKNASSSDYATSFTKISFK